MGVESLNPSISTPSLALPLQGGGDKWSNEQSGFNLTEREVVILVVLYAKADQANIQPGDIEKAV
jgi:hypothetical protein